MAVGEFGGGVDAGFRGDGWCTPTPFRAGAAPSTIDSLEVNDAG